MSDPAPAPLPEAAAPLEPSPAEGVPAGASWAECPGLVLRGFFMGTADVVPGVSGGTMALITGIYERLVGAIRSLDPRALKLLLERRFGELLRVVHWRFLAAVVCGQFLGVVVCTKGIQLPRLVTDLETRPLVYALFFGLIVGSVLTLGRGLRSQLSGGVIASGLVGTLAGLGVVNLVPRETPESALFVFLCGCVSICAMILPGISGSFVLLILGKYAYVLNAVGEVIHPAEGGSRSDPFLAIVLPFACGCALGLLTFARFLSWLLKRAEALTLSFMTGLMAGSLWVIWPFQDPVFVRVRGKQKLIETTPRLPEALDGHLAAVVGLATLGLIAVLGLEQWARRSSAPAD